MKTVIRFMTSAIVAAGISSVSHATSVTDIEIVNRTTGEHLPTYRHEGQLWIAGKPGDRYAIHVINKTGGRMLTVVSVDGINVVSGETAAQNQRGYVLSPRGAVRIPSQTGHRFQPNLDSDSKANWTVIPAQPGQPKVIT